MENDHKKLYLIYFHFIKMFKYLYFKNEKKTLLIVKIHQFSVIKLATGQLRLLLIFLILCRKVNKTFSNIRSKYKKI